MLSGLSVPFVSLVCRKPFVSPSRDKTYSGNTITKGHIVQAREFEARDMMTYNSIFCCLWPSEFAGQTDISK
jgi:hypothetical protein